MKTLLISLLTAALFATFAQAAPQSAVTTQGQPAIPDPSLDFIRSKLGWDSKANTDACTVREYVSATSILHWSNDADQYVNNLPETLFHLLLVGRSVRDAVMLGVVEFPQNEATLKSANGRWTKDNDYRTFWYLAPFPASLLDPNALKTPVDTIDNSPIQPVLGRKDATTQATVNSRFVKVGYSSDIVRACISFEDSCPCVSTFHQK